MNDLVPPADLAHRRRLGKNFAVRDRIRFHSTSDPELDGFGGTILGKSHDGLLSCYIVLLDKPHSSGDLALSMPEVCLEYDELELRAT